MTYIKMFVKYLVSVICSKSYNNTILKSEPIPHIFNNVAQRIHMPIYNIFSLNLVNNRKLSSDLNNSKDINISKLRIIKNLNLSNEDAKPFYNLSIYSLLEIHKVTKCDEENGFCKNRLYYISNRIKCSSSTLSKQIVKRTFVYKLSFSWLENSLNVLLDMNVSGDRILRDLWVLKYHHETIQNRLLRVKNSGIDNLHPWMVRCTEDILNRFIDISKETKKILGQYKSTKIYLAQRLNTTPEVIEDMCAKIPALKTIRVAKVKKFLDFLIAEGFDVEDIGNKPRIFAASQSTVKQRLEKLRHLGVSDINLNVLCRSKKDFQKYYKSIESISKQQVLVNCKNIDL